MESTSVLGSGTRNSMKNNGNHAARNCCGPRNSNTRPGNMNTTDNVCALRMRCECPNKCSTRAIATSAHPITGRGAPASGSSIRGQARHVSHAQMASTMGPWLCSSVVQIVRNRSISVDP